MTEATPRIYAKSFIDEAKEFDYVAIATYNFSDQRAFIWSGGQTPESWDGEILSQLTTKLFEIGADLAKRKEHTRTHNFVPRKKVIKMQQDTTLFGLGFAVKRHSRFWVYLDLHLSSFAVGIYWGEYFFAIRIGLISLNFHLERND